MAKDLTIATVGIREELVSHLRLLVRQACKKLPERWRFGLERNADLVIVDPNSFSGHMARTRAQASGSARRRMWGARRSSSASSRGG